MSHVLPVFIGLLMLGGVVLLLVPRRIQRMAERYVMRGPTARLKGLHRFVSSSAYLWNVRVVGVGAIIMALLLIVAIRASSGGAV